MSVIVMDGSDNANALSVGSVRQQAQKVLWCYRLCFTAALVFLSTLATMVHLQDSRSDIILLDTMIDRSKNTQNTIRGPMESSEVAAGEDRTVYFMNSTQLSDLDGFSASWLQRREDFMSMPLDRIVSCEAAAFLAFKGNRHKMRMTYDWMDWSVEHMSKWWKLMHWESEDNPLPYKKITHQFEKYVGNADKYHVDESNQPFKRAIAVIAFQAYRNDNNPKKGHDLTMMSLAATIESLRRAGFGRVIVGVLVEADYDIVQDAFQYLLNFVQPLNSHNPAEVVTRIGHLEVGIAVASQEYAQTRAVAINMPKATLMGLRDAFLYSDLNEADRSKGMTKNMTAWLGNKQEPSHWQYVYLTEPDTILQARPSALAQLKDELDTGHVLLPHRLQPIPHESDVQGMEKEHLYVWEKDFDDIIRLDPNNDHDSCCDEHAGPNFKPGRPPYFPKCSSFWYACDFNRRMVDNKDRHARLKPYKFIRLMGGTEIVTIAGSEHGRRCVPKKNAVCKLPSM